EKVERHFGEFGTLERVHVLRDKVVAFVTYDNRANAEFAKEAMSDQSLDHNEQQRLDDTAARTKANMVHAIIPPMDGRAAEAGRYVTPGYPTPQVPGVPVVDAPYAPYAPASAGSSLVEHVAGALSQCARPVDVRARTASLQNATNSGPQCLSAIMATYGDTSTDDEEEEEEGEKDEKEEEGEKNEKDEKERARRVGGAGVGGGKRV
ncbi:MAG: hypothetical protein BJ554DRAFT_3111, partial [Olpidium bornovanus]